MTLSPQAAQALEMIGIPAGIFPHTDGMDEQASALRTVAAGTGVAAEDAESTMRRTQQAYRGDGGTALAGHWQQSGNEGGHLAQANAAASTLPVALDGLSNVVKTAGVLAGATATYFTYRALMQYMSPDPTAPVRATAELLQGRHRTGKILNEVREGTGNVLTQAIRRKVIEPLENLIRTMKRPGGPPPAHAGAGGRVPAGPGPSMQGPVPRGGQRLEARGWFGRGGSADDAPPPTVQKAAENSAQHQANVNEARLGELEVQDRFAANAIRDAEKDGRTASAEALKAAQQEVHKEQRSRGWGRHN
ncbi:hypothetical protein GCM10009850_120820 [Nonomuraea monospora]|uniref:Uncharacterized protein n=2 Tax=Nonomuraea monospora TaxID=568818 RepID=A0ABP5PYJ5_9ACTN